MMRPSQRSATDGAFDPDRSDFDFLVEFPPGYDFGPWMGRYLEFKGELERLLGGDVDLVELNCVRNPFRRLSILKNRRVIYAA